MRKILCSVLAFLMIGCYITISYADELTDLQSKQETLQNQIQDATGNLEDVQSDINENLQQVQNLDERINESTTKIEELNTKITELKNSISEIEGKLTEAQENYENQKKILEARLIAMYEAGETQYLDVFLQSRNISEFLSNYFLITEIASYDMDLLEEMEDKKRVIDTAMQKLQNSKEELDTALQTQLKTSKILENTKKLRENYVAKLSEEEKKIQAQIDDYTTQVNALNAEILQLALQGIDTQYIGGVLAWPVPGYTRISSNYGMRYHPILHVNKLHTGVDIAAPMGANFVAANDGIVTKAGYNGAYGNMVIIDHGGGISTLYAHGSEILVQVGQTVKRNDPILKVGSTGYSTGPHAHFEVRINGVVTNPIEYITNGVIPESQNNTTTENNTTNQDNTTNTQDANNTAQP